MKTTKVIKKEILPSKRVSRDKGKKEMTRIVREVEREIKTNNKKNRKNKTSKNGGRRKQQSLRETFAQGLKMPDLTGPFRIPRAGGSVRTLLAMDRSIVTLTGNVANPVQAFQLGTIFSSAIGSTFTAPSSVANFTGGVTVSPGVQFPAVISLADVNFVAASVSAVYSGAPLSAKGELLLGRSIAIASGSSYSTMGFYPGTVREQLSYFWEHPLRVSAQKISETANEFIPVGNAVGDIELPFVMLNSNDPNISVTLEVTRIFEARSTTIQSVAVPYDVSEQSFTADLNAYQDAVASNGQDLLGSISSYIPEGFMENVSDQLRSLGKGAINAYTNHVFERLRGGSHSGILSRSRDYLGYI